MSENTETRTRLIAVPSMAPGGLSAQRSGHFGHCDYFTIIEVNDGKVSDTKIVENLPHQEGGCLDPVKLLASLGTTEIIVAGMGGRPRAFFEQLGIAVYADQELPTVGEVVDALLQGTVPAMTAQHVCGGGGCH